MSQIPHSEYDKYMFKCEKCGKLFEIQQSWAIMQHYRDTGHREFKIVKIHVVVKYYEVED